ncbi:MAG: hypothetical protein ABF743_10155 [Schleiferilactobacillus perolens]|uniref:hypothetical protein n=1 Tax=Schleiferilactobacillus perolens TaxID=100468 RepID=UPI0039E76969
MKTYTKKEMQKLEDIEAMFAVVTFAGKGIQELMIQYNLDEHYLPDGVFDDLNVVLGRLAKIQAVLRKESQDVLGKEEHGGIVKLEAEK